MNEALAGNPRGRCRARDLDKLERVLVELRTEVNAVYSGRGGWRCSRRNEMWRRCILRESLAEAAARYSRVC